MIRELAKTATIVASAAMDRDQITASLALQRIKEA
jgi:hypothetical protein